MSDSAPGTKPSSPPGEAQSKWPWVLLSVAFHALVLGWLVFLVPVKDIASALDPGSKTQAPAAGSASSELVQQVSREIEATQSDELRSKVEELLATEKMLAEVQEYQSTEFAALSRELSAEAPKLVEEAQTSAEEAQARAAQAQADALRLAEEFKALGEHPEASSDAGSSPETRATETKAKVAAAQETAKTAQAAATAAQNTASQQLAFREGASAAKNAQTAAVAAQKEANRKQDEATGNINAVGEKQRSAKVVAESAGQTKIQADATLARVEKLQQMIAVQTAVQNQRGAQIVALKQQPADSKGSTAKEIEKLSKAITADSGRLESTKSEFGKSMAKLAGLESKAAADAKEALRLSKLAEVAPAEAMAAQEAALAAQQKAREVQSKARSAMADCMASGTIPAIAAPATEPSTPVPIEGKGFAGLYDAAVQTEKQIAGQFQSIRATQVAVQRKIPVSEARKFVKTVTPARAEYSGASEGNPEDAAALERRNAAMEDALQQVDSMLALSRSMAFQATNNGKDSQSLAVSAAGMQAQADQADQLAGLATETEGGNASDLTELMKQIENGDAAGAKNSGQHGLTSGNGSGSGQGRDGGQGSGGTGPVGFRRGVPGEGVPAMAAVSESVPGRKVHSSAFGAGSKWMFVDTWYMIGPFPNPQRRNIETKFPPESIVDLDATYPVEGQNLRWQFVQTSTAGIRPPLSREYAIYYGYTTLWFDEAQDMWIATGSDDFSKLWINDMLVWASGSVQKVWKPDEGYRRVHFKKGLNRVLFRLENGHNDCMFSLMLNMQKAAG